MIAIGTTVPETNIFTIQVAMLDYIAQHGPIYEENTVEWVSQLIQERVLKRLNHDEEEEPVWE